MPAIAPFSRVCASRIGRRQKAAREGTRSVKVERFIRYLRASFYVPLASRLAREGLVVDRETANSAVARWLREVANARMHGATREVPSERLVIERPHLQALPRLYGGRSIRLLQTKAPERPMIGLQHPLSGNDAFAGGFR